MKKIALVFLFGLAFSGFAQAESAAELCQAEARDAGIEDASDFQAYVDECVEQIQAEMNNSQENNQQEATESSGES